MEPYACRAIMAAIEAEQDICFITEFYGTGRYHPTIKIPGRPRQKTSTSQAKLKIGKPRLRQRQKPKSKKRK
jgi:hypothetical protein